MFWTSLQHVLPFEMQTLAKQYYGSLVCEGERRTGLPIPIPLWRTAVNIVRAR
jgi:hypothetical protein